MRLKNLIFSNKHSTYSLCHVVFKNRKCYVAQRHHNGGVWLPSIFKKRNLRPQFFTLDSKKSPRTPELEPPIRYELVEVNLKGDIRSEEILRLLREGNIEAACDGLLMTLLEYPKEQLPQHFLGALIHEFLKYQQRGTFAPPRNIVQMLFERGVISMNNCKSYTARREIIVALDPMATKPDGFYLWSAFDGTFRGYFNAVLKMRGVEFAHSLALSLLRQIEPADMGSAYNAIISCAAWTVEPVGSIAMARQFMDEMMQMNLKPAPSTCHRLIVGTLNEKSGDGMQSNLNRAMAVFRATLPVVGVLPRETYLTLISFLDASSNGNPINFRNVTEVFSQMVEKKSTPNLLIYNIALKNYARLSSDPSAKDQAPHLDDPEDGVVEEERELLKGSWHLHRMAFIWRHMKANGVAPDTFTLNAFLELFCNGKGMDPLWLVAAMNARIELLLSHGAKMNGVSLMYLINTYGKLDNLQGINGVLEHISNGCADVDNFVLSSAINQNLRLRNPQGAIHWFDTMTGPDVGLVPDVAVLSLMVDVYSKLNKVDVMDKYWQMCCQPQLLSSGSAVPPTLNLTIYQRIINAYANVIKSLSAFAKPANTNDILWRVQMIFRRLQGEQHIHPDIFSYNVYLKAHISYLLTFQGKADFDASYAMAMQVYKMILEDARVCPDHITFSTMLNTIANILQKMSRNSKMLLEDAESITQDMLARKVPPSLYITSIMIKITGSAGRVIQMHSHFEQFLQMVDRPSAHFSPIQLLPVFNTYLNFLTAHNKGNFDTVIANMSERNVIPDIVTYRIWLKGLDRSRAKVRRMWDVLDHLNAQGNTKPTPLRIDEAFLLMVADVFRRAGGVEEMNRATLLLLEHHKQTSRLDQLRPQFYLAMLKLVMLPISSSNPANRLKSAHSWLRMLADLPPEKAHAQAISAHDLMASSFEPLKSQWESFPEVKQTLLALKHSHIDSVQSHVL